MLGGFRRNSWKRISRDVGGGGLKRIPGGLKSDAAAG